MPSFYSPSRACHGNYPQACHTKLSLICRPKKKSALPHLFQFSAHFQIERDAHLQSSFLFNAFLFEKVPLNPFVCCFAEHHFFPSTVYTLFTWWKSPLASIVSVCPGERGGRHGIFAAIEIGFECGRPCKISHQ